VRRRLREQHDETALAWALTELVRRHESLRTTFVTRNGEPRQQITPPEPVAPEIIDLESVPAADREAVVEEHVHKEVQRPFSLARGPLFRPVLLRLAPDEHELIASIHHIVADGWAPSPPCPSCRSSTRTSRSGSASGSPARCWRRTGPTCASTWPRCPRRSSCP